MYVCVCESVCEGYIWRWAALTVSHYVTARADSGLCRCRSVYDDAVRGPGLRALRGRRLAVLPPGRLQHR